MPKHPRYQDYVIKDGKLVGEFEEMYRDHVDPWDQTTREAFSAEKAIALNAISALKPATVMELGCGLGHFTSKIKALGVSRVVGIDISATAIEKARGTHTSCEFAIGDILDFHLYEKYNPDVIVLAEISWYVLDKLSAFITYMREQRPTTYLIHLLVTYSPGEQKYGKDQFTNLDEILRYFGLNYVEFGQVTKPLHGNVSRTYFLGKYGPLSPVLL
jgi:SAM-dependent methyltransferase